MKLGVLCWLGASVFALGCGPAQQQQQPPAARAVPPVSSNNTSAPSAAEDGHPKQAQPKLQTIKLWVGTNEVTAELAYRPLEIQTGMMWRTNMAEMEGMLFIFGGPRQVAFWMKNTLLPLSCAYINPEGTILEIHDMKPKDESPIPSKTAEVQYVLEMNQGWFQRHGVTPGMVIATERGSLAQTFFRRQP